MKKVISLIKNGVTYQMGALNDADVEKIKSDIQQNATDISAVSGATDANATRIGNVETNLADNYYTSSETDDAIDTAIAAIDKEIFEFVNVLPTEDIKTNKIYVVPTEGATGETNEYTEWLYKGDKWEKVGEFKADTDISNIYTKSETYSKTEVDGIVSNLDNLEFLTQAAYDALANKNPKTTYAIFTEVTE